MALWPSFCCLSRDGVCYPIKGRLHKRDRNRCVGNGALLADIRDECADVDPALTDLVGNYCYMFGRFGYAQGLKGNGTANKTPVQAYSVCSVNIACYRATYGWQQDTIFSAFNTGTGASDVTSLSLMEVTSLSPGF
jgi:hypothetical protein